MASPTPKSIELAATVMIRPVGLFWVQSVWLRPESDRSDAALAEYARS